MKKRCLFIPVILIFFCVIFITLLIYYKNKRGAPSGLFSWQTDVFSEEKRDELFETMEYYGLNQLYQNIPESVSVESVTDFFEAAGARNIEIYLLAGEPEWSLDASGQAMLDCVERARWLKEQLPGGDVLKGVMMDTEPYLLEAWQTDARSVMETYVSAMCLARQQAAMDHLLWIACIPYYYDTEGLTGELCRLIEEGCDGIAVMNYYRGMEGEHIAGEYALALASEKTVITIYELQAPGSHGLTEKNTYYNESFQLVMDSWKEVCAILDGQPGWALHDYEALKEVEWDE